MKILIIMMVLLGMAGAGLLAVADIPSTLPATAPGTQPAKELILDLGGQVTMKLALIPPGKFLMGSPRNEEGRQDNESLPVEVTISKPFYVGVYAVTVDQYAQFVKEGGQKLKSPVFKQTGDHPAVNMGWSEAQAFCKWLSQKTGKTVVLPTEAQREYACRAGTTTRFNFGDRNEDLCKHENYCDKSNTSQMSRPGIRDMAHSDGFNNTAPVGSFKPNGWGLYDMQGNVWEWCSDYFASGYASPTRTDPTGPASGTTHALRGGCWVASADQCRAASRQGSKTDQGYVGIGLRVVVLAEGQ